jgi:hypothetical protein
LVAPIVIYIIQQNNLKYYKLVGREPVEIECWLKTRKWYPEFYSNIQKAMLSNPDMEYDIEEIVTGRLNTLTISSAFPWVDTDEGSVYWGEREKEFLKWYFGQYIDFHIIK